MSEIALLITFAFPVAVSMSDLAQLDCLLQSQHTIIGRVMARGRNIRLDLRSKSINSQGTAHGHRTNTIFRSIQTSTVRFLIRVGLLLWVCRKRLRGRRRALRGRRGEGHHDSGEIRALLSLEGIDQRHFDGGLVLSLGMNSG